MHPNRRNTIKILAAGAATLGLSLPEPGLAQPQKRMVVVQKIAGIPWVDAMANGVSSAGAKFGIAASLVGPASVDPAQQLRLLEDVLAKKPDVVGFVPLDVKVAEPLLRRAQADGIKVVTLEGAEQVGRDWNVDLVETVSFGETVMEKLAQELGGEGEYIVFVGTLTTPLHNRWANAAIAYQRARYPRMQLAAERFPGGDDVELAQRTTLDVIKANPKVRGVVAFGANGPIGAGNAVRQAKLEKRVAVVGTCVPSQAKPLIEAGIIREGFLWNPVDSGYAMVAVAKLLLDGQAIQEGLDIPGLGPAKVDVANGLISFNKIMRINKATLAGLTAIGI